MPLCFRCVCVCVCELCVRMCVTPCPTFWQEGPAGSGGAPDPTLSIIDLDRQMSLLVPLSHSPTHSPSQDCTLSLSQAACLSLLLPVSMLSHFPPLSPFFCLSHNLCQYIRMLFAVCQSSLFFLSQPLSLFVFQLISSLLFLWQMAASNLS